MLLKLLSLSWGSKLWEGFTPCTTYTLPPLFHVTITDLCSTAAQVLGLTLLSDSPLSVPDLSLFPRHPLVFQFGEAERGRIGSESQWHRLPPLSLLFWTGFPPSPPPTYF